jgi:hypothetical protein
MVLVESEIEAVKQFMKNILERSDTDIPPEIKGFIDATGGKKVTTFQKFNSFKPSWGSIGDKTKSGIKRK